MATAVAAEAAASVRTVRSLRVMALLLRGMAIPGVLLPGPRAVGVLHHLDKPDRLPLTCRHLRECLKGAVRAVASGLVDRDVRMVVVVGGGAAAVPHEPPGAGPDVPDALPVDDVHDAEPPRVL